MLRCTRAREHGFCWHSTLRCTGVQYFTLTAASLAKRGIGVGGVYAGCWGRRENVKYILSILQKKSAPATGFESPERQKNFKKGPTSMTTTMKKIHTPAPKPFDQTWQAEPEGGRFGAPPMTAGSKSKLNRSRKKPEVPDHAIRAVPPSLIFNNLTEVRAFFSTADCSAPFPRWTFPDALLKRWQQPRWFPRPNCILDS